MAKTNEDPFRSPTVLVLDGPIRGSQVWHDGAFVRVGDRLTSNQAEELKAAGWTIKEILADKATEPEAMGAIKHQPFAEIKTNWVSSAGIIPPSKPETYDSE